MRNYNQESVGGLMQRQDVDDRKVKELPGSFKRRLLVVDEDLDDLLYYTSALQHQAYRVRSIPSYTDGPRFIGCVAHENASDGNPYSRMAASEE
jgi:hypothetical protein